MAPPPRWRRILRVCAITTLGPLFAAAICVPIQQQILRYLAEHLLEDIRAIDLGKSTWSDAQTLMTKWGAWGGYEGSCTTDRCEYHVALQQVPTWIMDRLPPQGVPDWLQSIFRQLGGRGASVGARIQVINGVIWGKDYFVVIEGSNSGSEEDGHGLVASADTQWRTKDFNWWMGPNHPDYAVMSPFGRGFKVVCVRFTPFADPQTVRALMDFNLDCMTRRNPCRNQSDLMPAVWKQAVAEKHNFEVRTQANTTLFDRGHASPEFLGRDRENVVLAEVVSTQRVPEAENEHRFRILFRLKQRLKRGQFWNVGEIKEAALPSLMNAPCDRTEASLISKGRVLILTLDSRPFTYRTRVDEYIDLDQSGVIPLTEDNLKAVRRGISQDIFPERRDVFP
jgi:hypothetical protein